MALVDAISQLREIAAAINHLSGKAEVAADEIGDPTSPDEYKDMIYDRLVAKLQAIGGAVAGVIDIINAAREE